MSSPSELRVLYAERYAAMSVRGPLVVSVWSGPVSIDLWRMRRLLTAMQRLRASSHRELMLHAYVMAEDAGIPEPETRKVAAQLLDHFDHGVAIHEGESVRASTLRAVLTNVTMLSRAPAAAGKMRVVSRTGQAARIIAPLSHGQLDEMTVYQTIEETRRISLGGAAAGSR